MTFSTEKRKIFKVWNDSIENQFQITNLSSNDKIILDKINDLNDTDFVYNNVIELSSDWLIPETQAFDGFTPFRMWKEFEVVINGISKNLIPYIESKVFYRLGDSEISLPIPDDINNPGVPFDEELSDFLINSIVEIKEVIDPRNRNIVYRTSIFLGHSGSEGIPPELQFRFFINITNPSYYQST